MLEVRKNLKAKKPNFLRQNAVDKKRVPMNYRKPRGCSSRMRIGKAGYPLKVSPGYQSGTGSIPGGEKSCGDRRWECCHRLRAKRFQDPERGRAPGLSQNPERDACR